MTVADHCAELATLAPMLGPALTRDNTHTGRGRPIAPLNLYNTDVLIAKITLAHEIPAAAIRSAELLHERWQVRDIRISLIALPRFAGRMHDLGMAAEHRQLELLTAKWVRITKQALGLATRPQQLRQPFTCPYCTGPLWLDAAREGYMDPRDPTAPPTWVDYGAHVYCPVPSPLHPDGGADWPQPQWEHLLRLLEQAAHTQVSA